MKYTKETLQTKQVKFEIELSKEEWEKELDRAYEQEKGKYKVQGFRAGKIPRKIIEKNYGETVFYNEALNHSFYLYYNEILKEEKDLDVVGNPSLDVKKLDDKGVTLVVITDVKPEVKLGQYKGLKIERETLNVTEEEVDAELNKMVERSARKVKVEREVKTGDIVNIDFTGMLNGIKFEGGSEEKYDLEIGSGQFIPGFEEQIVGMKTGEERVITVTFPENYSTENLKGKVTTFNIKLHEVREKQLPALDDNFAKDVSEFDTLKEYREDIRANILKEKEKKAEGDYDMKLIEKISDGSSVEVTEGMVDEQLDMFIHDFEHRLAHQGLKLEDYVKYIGTTVEDLRKSRLDDAKKTCKIRYVIDEIIKTEGVKVEQTDIDRYVEEGAKQSGKSKEEFKKQLDDHMMGHVVNDLLIEKLLNFLRENNK